MAQNSNLKLAHSELTLRLLSALFLIAISVVGTVLGSWYFAVLILAVSFLMAWEWHKLAHNKETIFFLILQCTSITLAVVLAVTHYYPAAIVSLVLGFVGIHILSAGKLVRSRAPIWSSVGCLYIGLPAIAMIWFREDPQFGFATVLYLYILTWSNDSAAYFGGKTIGGIKLLPSVSPNKTWAGFISGLVACVIVGFLFTLFYTKIDLLHISIISIALGVAVQLGDLSESAMKRKFGLKDTSALIPGHGGILDRVDGMVFSVCLAALIALCIDTVNPGVALLLNNLVAQ